MVVGNKSDLRSPQTEVQGVGMAEREAHRWRYVYRECSALTGEGVTEVFERAVRQVQTARYYNMGRLSKEEPCSACTDCQLL
jgi:GTPase SAR1 family protein